ncbi:ABC transporter permease [Paenibacillus hodogayensis]|uniref:ABC transporter permease n=1 Tax=Paenibacillus hodogayensis TaxID=279208 RepID=A0ABV5W3C6_9BACL
MHAFSRLLKTELRNRRNEWLIIVAALVVLNVLLSLLQLFMDRDQLAFVMTLNIVVYCVMLLAPLVHGFSIWREEWKQRSIVLILMIPVPRAHLVTAKCMAILLEALLITGVTAVGLSVQYVLSDGMLFRAEPLITLTWGKLWLAAHLMIAATCLVLLCFFSMLLGKCSRKLSIGIAFLVFVAGLLVTVVAAANLPPLLVFVFVGAACFGGSVYLLEKKVAIG